MSHKRASLPASANHTTSPTLERHTKPWAGPGLANCTCYQASCGCNTW